MAHLRSLRFVLCGFVVCTLAQKPQYPPSYPLKPELPFDTNYAPNVIPAIKDVTAPNAQQKCPGYKATNVRQTSAGVTADLTLAGKPCDVFGTDITTLSLNVEYQSAERLLVQILPASLGPNNISQYVLDSAYAAQPAAEAGASKGTSDFVFSYSNSPSFSFKVQRKSNGETIFDTTGNVLVFENQFLEIVTSMVSGANIYGLGDGLNPFRFPQTYTKTFWNSYNDINDNVINVNTHYTSPFYLETRYQSGGSNSHGVYARNAHGQDWLLRDGSLTYRTIGGSFEFYFLSGPSPTEAISQYHTGIVGTPYLQPYFTLGFQQNRWGYLNWTNLRTVLDLYKEQNIQLEVITTDLDPYFENRMFTLKPYSYEMKQGQEFLEKLHADGQFYFPILNPAMYVPDPTNKSDIYPPYNRGQSMNAYIKSGNHDYYGVLWAGIQSYVDFLTSQGQQFWTNEITNFHDQLDFDGFWLDVNDATAYSTGSFTPTQLKANPVHVPFPLPGDPQTSDAVNYVYPEEFGKTNASEAKQAASLSASQAKAYPPPPTHTPTVRYRKPSGAGRNVTFPPYAINNAAVPGGALVKQVISPDATHGDQYNTEEYDVHNIYGHTSCNATYNAMLAAKPGLRPYVLCRAPFAGTGSFAGHWGGDTNAAWGNMYFGIIQALANSIAGTAFFGVETCGFNGNTDFELCTRWMQLSAWFPLYRNHNNRNTIAQEAYRFFDTAEATRRIMNIRYSLLPYTYTLFYQANSAGQTVFRALQWEFPNDESLKAVETQFMSGPALLITPVLAPLATTVKGVLPSGSRWYDWYTLKGTQGSNENRTFQAPLTYQPIHVRGGYTIPLQKAANTTTMSRKSPWSLLVALDNNGASQGELYLDDGISLVQAATKYITMSFSGKTFKATIKGSYEDNLPLANLTIAGISTIPSSVSVSIGGKTTKVIPKIEYCNGALHITGLESATKAGIWSGDVEITLNGSKKKAPCWGNNWGGGAGLKA